MEKIAFKVVQMKFLAMHINNQKLSFDIFTVGNLQNIFMEHDLYLSVKIDNFGPYNVFLAHATYDWFCGPGSHIDRQINQQIDTFSNIK